MALLAVSGRVLAAQGEAGQIVIELRPAAEQLPTENVEANALVIGVAGVAGLALHHPGRVESLTRSNALLEWEVIVTAQAFEVRNACPLLMAFGAIGKAFEMRMRPGQRAGTDTQKLRVRIGRKETRNQQNGRC